MLANDSITLNYLTAMLDVIFYDDVRWRQNMLIAGNCLKSPIIILYMI